MKAVEPESIRKMFLMVARGLLLAVLVAVAMSANAQEAGVSSADAATAEDPLRPRVTSVLGTERRTSVVWRNVRPAREMIVYSNEWLDGLPGAEGGNDLSCLAEALYFEARGERVRGQFAVAEVILNRVDSPLFPDTVCDVVNQGTGKRYGCQFTYNCDGLKEVIHERQAHERVAKIARLMLDGAERTLTSGATHYHTDKTAPRWARRFSHTATIGAHHFYRLPDSRTKS